MIVTIDIIRASTRCKLINIHNFNSYLLLASDSLLNAGFYDEAGYMMEQATYFVKDQEQDEIKIAFLAFKLHCIMKDTSNPEDMKIVLDLFKQLYCNPHITP